MFILLPVGTDIVLPVGYMDQPTGLLKLYGRSAEEVIQIWITSSGGYVNFEFLKITAPPLFHQRFESGTLGSES